MIYATMGKILWVDLTTAQCTEEVIPDEVYEKYLSGIGLAAYILYREIPPSVSALGPENVLGFLSGLLNGTGSLFMGRWMAVAKSPLTDTWGEANCGGTFAVPLKRSGYDGVFFKGISPKPVYLEIIDGKAEIKDAEQLWGLDAVETETILKKRCGKGSAVACIGRAGEKLSLISGISNDYGRLAARSGLGAVMGSKRLKAVVVKGKGKIETKQRDEITRITKKFRHWMDFRIPLPAGTFLKFIGILIRFFPHQVAQDGLLYKTMLQIWGTISMNQVSIEMGDSPIQNWRGTHHDFSFELSNRINPDLIINREKKKYYCNACPLGCGGELDDGNGNGNGIKDGIEDKENITHKPEYETVLSLSGLLKNHDLQSIYAMNERLNREGMDSISAGGTIAFALECYEKGLITKQDTGGLELNWGDSQAISILLEKMIEREGIGDLLADGSRKAAQRIGNGAEDYAVHAGGQELAMHDGRNDPGFALHYVVEPMPGRHTIGAQLYYEMFKLWTRIESLPKVSWIYSKNKKYQNASRRALEAAACSQFMQVLNGIGGCLFGALIGVNRFPVFEWINAATGWQKTPSEYLEIGARIQTRKQAFNAREGMPLYHTINKRALGLPPQQKGANRGRSVNLEEVVREYWKLFGWDEENGKPKGNGKI